MFLCYIRATTVVSSAVGVTSIILYIYRKDQNPRKGWGFIGLMDCIDRKRLVTVFFVLNPLALSQRRTSRYDKGRADVADCLHNNIRTTNPVVVMGHVRCVSRRNTIGRNYIAGVGVTDNIVLYCIWRILQNGRALQLR